MKKILSILTMKNPKGFIPIVIVILISALALAAAGTALWYKSEKAQETKNVNQTVILNENSNNNSNIAVNTNTVAANTNTAATDETAGWKTYTNSTVGYSVKYPADWTVKDINEPSFVSGQTARYISISNAKATRSLHLGVRKSSESKIDIWARTGIGAGDFQAGDSVAIAGSSVQSIKLVYQRKAVEIFYSPVEHATDPVTIGSFDVSAYFSNKSDDNSDLSTDADYLTANKMLSTLTFLDDTTGWKTYTNTRYGYSFRYPSGYTLTEAENINIKKDNASMTARIKDRKLDPNNILGIYGKKEPILTDVGPQRGYQFLEGDAGCGGDFVQTALSNSKILELYFGKCDQEVNELFSDIDQRNQILSTFQFTSNEPG